MREIIILAAGCASKMFPYDKVSTKTMRPVANRPLMEWNINTLRKVTNDPIHIITKDEYKGVIGSKLFDYENIIIHCIGSTMGTADTLLSGLEFCGTEDFLLLHGDTLIDEDSLTAFYKEKTPAALVYPLDGNSSDWICCNVENGKISAIGAHHRGTSMTHRMAAFVLPKTFGTFLERTPEYFPGMKVGQAAPCERYVESSLSCYLSYHHVKAVEGKEYYFDVDKPWHLLEANSMMVDKLCGELKKNILSEGTSIHKSAEIKGFVKMGKKSYIGKNVTINGTTIVGNNTIIDNGAMIMGNVVIGDNCRIKNYCQIYGSSTIGNECIIDHTAEFLGGMLMEKVYLFHYAEIYGIIGNNVDFGTGTVCGTLRFDDGETVHQVNGRTDRTGSAFSNCTYIGDYTRTGVGVIFLPGSKIGANTVISPGIVVKGDVGHNSCLKLEQQITVTQWGPNKYGW